MTDPADVELIVHGHVSLADGTTAPVYYVHEIEDDKAQVVINTRDENGALISERWVTLTEPYSSLAKWRNARNLFLVEA